MRRIFAREFGMAFLIPYWYLSGFIQTEISVPVYRKPPHVGH